MNNTILNKLCEFMKRDGVDALMVAPSEDMVFLLGKSTHLCERFQALVVKNDGDYFYICNLLTVDEAHEMIPGHDVYGWFDCDNFTVTVKKAFEEHGLIGKTIAVNGAVRAFNICKILEDVDVKFVNGKGYLEETRMIKSAEDLENLRKAALIADKAYEDVIKFIKPGMTEADVSNKIRESMLEHGADTAGGGIVARGENAALPHYMGKNGVIKEKDIVEMDYGCTVKGMHSDITRTLFIGEPTEREKLVYNTVLKANLAGEAAAVNGAYIPDVEKAARSVIEEAGFGPYFTHRLGHGIGYAGHEAPYITGVNCINLEPGMAFSIEPGIYITDEIGVRIEDIVIINEKGETEVINKATKEMIVIK